MNLTYVSAVVLFFIFVTAEFCGHALKIYNDKFFNKFHFAGGLFSYLFIFSLTSSVLFSLLLVLIIGLLWEAHEWILWRYFFKKNKHYELDDTPTDIAFDMAGAITGVILVALILR